MITNTFPPEIWVIAICSYLCVIRQIRRVCGLRLTCVQWLTTSMDRWWGLVWAYIEKIRPQWKYGRQKTVYGGHRGVRDLHIYWTWFCKLQKPLHHINPRSSHVNFWRFGDLHPNERCNLQCPVSLVEVSPCCMCDIPCHQWGYCVECSLHKQSPSSQGHGWQCRVLG